MQQRPIADGGAMFEEEIRRDATFSLADALDWAETDFRDEFISHWGLEATEPPPHVSYDDWRQLRQLFGLAAQVAQVGTTLVKKKGLGPHRLAEPDVLANEAATFQEQVNGVLRSVEEKLGREVANKAFWKLLPQTPNDPRTRSSIYRTSLELEASRLFAQPVNVLAQRLQSLLPHLVNAQNERVSAYLGRVTTCFCLGLTSELGVMARAVLEAALKDRIATDDRVRSALSIRSSDRVSLEMRLRYLDTFDLASKDERRAMDRVKSIGDGVAHPIDAPFSDQAAIDPDSIMGDLVVAINALDRIRNSAA